jgi:hypothetical protein
MRSLSFIVVCIVLVSNAWGQDTTRRAVRVTSSFKPVLKDAAKINFNASPPNVDTTRPRLQYDIPNQNLLFAYQPGTLRPLALSVDTGGYWDSWNYAKLGYGSLNTPYFETGLSLGDGKTDGLNIYGRHISSTGKVDFQKNRNTTVELNGFIKAGNNIELNGQFRGEQSLYNKYGFEPKGLTPNEDSLKVDLQNVGIRLGFHNIDRGKYGLSYAPSFEVDLFSDRMNNRETNAYFKLPLKKTIAGRFEADVAFEGNVTSYSPDDKNKLKNNWFSLAPAVLVKTENVNLQAGIKPTWDNGEFKLFPNIMAEFSSSDKRITIHGGWIGYIRSNTYRSLATYNPFIWAPAFTSNSSIREFYGGVKGALTDHFNYSVRAGLNKITNQPLFTNDTSAGTDGKSFAVATEPELNALNFTGELGYTSGERFSLRSVLRLNRYSGLSAHEKPWGLLPMEFNTSMRLQILKDLFVKTDLTAFDGAWYQTRENGRGSLQGAVDLSAGLEFAIVKNIKLWVQFNNIFNKEYERWKQYPVYGFNMLGGVVFSFAKNNQ